MNNKFVKAINIVLIFVIILGLGITKSFAVDSAGGWGEETGNYKAMNYADILNFVNSFGGIPSALPDEVVKYFQETVNDHDINSEIDDTIHPTERAKKLEEAKTMKAQLIEKMKIRPILKDEALETAKEIIKTGMKSSDMLYYEGDLSNPGEDRESKVDEALTAGELEEEERDASGNKIYKQPSVTRPGTSSGSLDDMLSDADAFVQSGDSDVISTGDLQSFSNMLYNILFEVGVAVAVIVGSIIGIKFMLASVEEKAQYKELLVPYVVGCIIVFGSFAIWKLAVTLFGSL